MFTLTSIPLNRTGRARPVPTGGAALGVRWLVLLVILFGTLVSSVGGVNSHGIAAIASAAHAAAPGALAGSDAAHGHSHEHSHGHSHEDSQDGEDLTWDTASAGFTADHPHHGADHSHDKAHAVPGAWASATVPLPGWRWHVRSWPETLQPYRLERPPMG